jgi:hypothetical protein
VDEPPEAVSATGDHPALVGQPPATAAASPPPPDERRTRVVTAAGTIYKLDPYTRTVFRLPDRGAELPRDGERVPLLSWPEPVMGESLTLHLLVRGDGVPTVRRTTPVVRINYR